VVEDDPVISSLIRIGLEKNDSVVDIAFDSAVGEKLALTRRYDVMVLDVVIPGISGFELCKKIRNGGIQTPIILLTSLDSVEDKITGFECGADDYLLKPFSFRELWARIKALHRRNRDSMVNPILKISDLEVDTLARRVKRSNREITLTPTEFKILEHLMSNRGKVMDRITLAEKIWGFSFNTGTNVIDVHISSLRKKIDRDFDKKLFRTVKGFGYAMTDDE